MSQRHRSKAVDQHVPDALVDLKCTALARTIGVTILVMVVLFTAIILFRAEAKPVDDPEVEQVIVP